MINKLKFYKLAALPNTLAPSSVYLIPNIINGYLDIHVSDKDGIGSLRTLGFQDVVNILTTHATEVFSQISQVNVKIYSFGPSLKLNVLHNLNTVNYSFSIVNGKGERVYAPDTALNANEFEINFADPESGTLMVTFFTNSIPVNI